MFPFRTFKTFQNSATYAKFSDIAARVTAMIEEVNRFRSVGKHAAGFLLETTGEVEGLLAQNKASGPETRT